MVGKCLAPVRKRSKIHEHVIDSESMQPGGKLTFTSKRSNLSQQLNKDVLRQILSLTHVPRHAQTHGIDLRPVPVIQGLNVPDGASSNSLRQLVIRLCLAILLHKPTLEFMEANCSEHL